MLGHLEDPVIEEACTILRRTCSFYEWLGSYPLAENIEP
jgi:chorismate mutase/prephenate dehydratase